MKRQWLYNENGGKLFESEDAIAKAINDGYVDTPAKVGVVETVVKKPTRAKKSKAVQEDI